jgi:hypothetical protein
VPLSRFWPGEDNRFLTAVTELNTKEEMDCLIAALGAGR